MKQKIITALTLAILLLSAVNARAKQQPEGKYDNKDAGWTYYGNWTLSQPVSGPYLNTITYSTAIGNVAEFVVVGSQITLTYSKYYNRGVMAVYVDGELETNINQYKATRQWQAEWTSGDLGEGEHTIKLVHTGGSIVDIDAIEVREYTPPLPNIPSGTPIYLLIGQSNMSGRGTEYPDPMPSDPLAWMFGDDYRFCLLREPADAGCGGGYVDAVNWDSNAGFGPSLDFALRMRELDPSKGVVVINCAKGSTYLDQWLPSQSDNTLMGACLKRTRAALSVIEGGYVAGVLVAQGESDAGERSRAYAWRDNFEVIVNYLRAEFGDVPFVIAQLGSHEDDTEKPYWSVVQDQQLLSSQTMQSVALFATNDLGVQPDGIHFTTASYRVMGRRFADYLHALTPCQ